jgi:hypothetical protein
MPVKARTESNLLRILSILSTRGSLTEDEQKYFLNLQKGYEGEVQFDLLTEQLQCDCFILNDLLLEFNNTEFQIDTTIIYQDTISFFEVKNFQGDFCYSPDHFQTTAGKEIKNPLDQLKRSKFLLRQLLQNLGCPLPIEANIIFINNEFTLYQAPLNQPFIYPTQLNRLMKKLSSKPSKLTNMHKKLADTLVSLHQIDSKNTRLPNYHYQDLKKGITCKACNSLSVSVQRTIVKCTECGCVEMIVSSVLRSVEEFKLLFPERKITTNEIHDWCRVINSKKRISRILENNFKVTGVHQWTFYE